jgi:hypothetical protein
VSRVWAIRFTEALLIAVFIASALSLYKGGPLQAYVPNLIAPSVCVPGSQVSPIRTTPFAGGEHASGRSDMITQVGDILRVKYQSENRCYVNTCNYSGSTCFDGSVSVDDIGTVEKAREIVRSRAINRYEDISLGELSQKLHQSLAKRAQSKRPGPTRYDEGDLKAAIKFIELCAEITEPQMNEMIARSRRGDRAAYLKYNRCYNNSPVGTAVSDQVDKSNRKLLVGVQLADPSRGGRYAVRVLFARDKDGDGNILDDKERSMDTAIANFFEVYGVANYHVSK